MSASLPLSMSSFKKFAINLSPEVTVCIQGRHGIGKSQSVYQIAKQIHSDFYKNPSNPTSGWKYEDGLPVVERRLSQMTEGDILGLPFSDGATTEFKPVSWLIDACTRPVLLFLDERNRALEGVKQAVFQLMDSKAFYGHKLHPETRIYIAENVGEQYSVNQVDPAELSRAAVVTLDPTVKDWLDWAGENCSDTLCEFIRGNEKDLEHTGLIEPNTKYPDRRAWAKLDAEINRLGLYESPTDMLLYHIAGSMVGPAIGQRYAAFCRERNREISAEDILKNWGNCKKRLGKLLTQEKYIELATKCAAYFTKRTSKCTRTELEQYLSFVDECPPETVMMQFTQISKQDNVEVCGKQLIYLLLPTILKINGTEVPQDNLDQKERILKNAPTSAPSSDGTGTETEGAETPKKKGPGRPKKTP